MSNTEQPRFLRPFMRWVGGKQRMIHKLRLFLPREGSYTRYFDPFLGAGSMFFSQPWENAVLNDLNYHLINTYRQAREHPADLQKLAEVHAKQLNAQGKEYYYLVRETYNNHLALSSREDYESDRFEEDRLEQAACFLFLIYANYNGIFRVNSDGKYNVPIGKGTVNVPPLSHLEKVSQRLQATDLRSGNYLDLKDEIDDRAFVYLDPPYPDIQPPDNSDNGKSDSVSQPFSEAHHHELAEFAREIKQKGAQIMVSVAERNKVFPDETSVTKVRAWYPEEEGWVYNASGVSRTLGRGENQYKVRELIITSYQPEEIQNELF